MAEEEFPSDARAQEPAAPQPRRTNAASVTVLDFSVVLTDGLLGDSECGSCLLQSSCSQGKAWGSTGGGVRGGGENRFSFIVETN